MENWWRLTFEPLLSIARENGVAEVAQNARGELTTVMPQFLRGAFAMVNRGHEAVIYSTPEWNGERFEATIGTYESGELGFFWAEPLSPEEIEEYVL